MILAKVKDLQGKVLDHGKFQSEAEALAWFEPISQKGVYGQPYKAPVYDGNNNLLEEEIQAHFTIECEPYSKPQSEINSEAKAFLASTDWHIVKHVETGYQVPQNILEARADARASIVE